MDIYCIKTTISSTLINLKKVSKHCISFILAVLLIGSAFGQSQTISLQLNDVDLETAFSKIRAQTDISFIYNDEELSNAPNISISVENVTVEKALEQLLKDTGLTFEKVNTTIVIKPAKKNKTSSMVEPEILKQTIRG